MKTPWLGLSLCIAIVGCSDSTPVGGNDLGGNGKHDMRAQPQDMTTTGTHDLSGQPPADMTVQGNDDLTMSGNPDLTTMGGNDAATTGGVTTIFTVLMENTSYDDVITTGNHPYIDGLVAKYGLATNYMDSGSHPSLPNYLYLVSGAPQYPGFFDISPTTFPFPVAKDNLGSQMTAASIPWRAYMENMGSPCALADTGTYAAKHNPFVYFTDLQMDTATCNQVDVDYSSFSADLAKGTYRYMWITPDLNSDGHDTDITTADTWLSQNIPQILNSATYKAGGVLFIVWDEGKAVLFQPTVDHVAMIVASPKLKMAPMTSGAAYTHASYLKYVEDTLGLPELGAAGTAGLPSLQDFLK